jgi:hypothetical protein
MPNASTRMALECAKSWYDADEPDAMEMPPEIGNAMNPEFNMPIAVYLASEANTATQGLYTQCLGRTAKLLIGVPPGWQAHRQSAPSVDDIAAHWGEICDMSRGFVTPTAPSEELAMVLAQDSQVPAA